MVPETHFVTAHRDYVRLVTPDQRPDRNRRRLDTPAMDVGPLRDLLTVVLGVGTGVLSGLFGVGGGVISQPGMRLLGLEPSPELAALEQAIVMRSPDVRLDATVPGPKSSA